MQREVMRLGVRVIAAASAVGKKEAEGPLGDLFDKKDETDRFGSQTWEAAESNMQKTAFETVLCKGKCEDRDVDALFAGDLLNQCVGSAYGLLGFDIPYFGLYGACSTCAEGLLLASMTVAGGRGRLCGAVTSSHYCAAERQYRTPLEYGAQRPPTAQWTVTGSGAFLVGNEEWEQAPDVYGVRITRGMPGKVLEKGIRDANNMGAAMAPAAQNTLIRFFEATRERPQNYDLIVTGDLGFEGGSILEELMRAAKYPLGERYADCGQLIYYRKAQDIHGGGSGCGCSAVVLASYLLPRLAKGELRRILFLSTGAMMSPDSIKQGQSIPAVAHLLELEAAPCAPGR